MEMEDWDNLIQTYFQSGFSNSEILAVILLQHNVIMSERTLKRIMHRLNLFRRKHFSPIMDVADYIFELLNTSSQLHGYRWIHLKCLQRGFVVTQRTIRLLLQQLDPHGVQLRSRGRLQRRKYHCPGPNYVWHIDSYDKLKRYGIAINGCIDGFSRKIVWLEAYLTSNDPKVIASYYLDSVEKCGGCPTLVRADLGTENTHLTQMQTFLRSDDDQEQNCVILGSSTNNTRIESWWAICRKHCANFWMRLFHHLKEDGYFTGDVIDVGLIQFCFMKMIQEELDVLVAEWNTHQIRHNSQSSLPSGRPILIYSIPELYNTMDYICPVDEDKLQLCKNESSPKSDYPCDRDLYELCCLYIEENNWLVPTQPHAMVDLYMLLRNAIYEEL